MRLSTFSYYADFFVCIALIALQIPFLVQGGTWLQGVEWLMCAVTGAVCWTAIEYVVHRWLYHKVPYFKAYHDAHHAEPDAHIGAPPFVGILLILFVSFAPFVYSDFYAACGLTTGMLAGYMAYMLVHHAAHYWNPPIHSWLYQLRRHHALHHHQSIEANYGITTSFWDYVFGTMREMPRAPRRFEAR